VTLSFSPEEVPRGLGALGPRAPAASPRDLGQSKNLEAAYDGLHLPGLASSVPQPASEEPLPGLDRPGAVILSDVDRAVLSVSGWRTHLVPGGFALRLPPREWPEGWVPQGAGIGAPDSRPGALWMRACDPWSFCVWETISVPVEFVRRPGNA